MHRQSFLNEVYHKLDFLVGIVVLNRRVVLHRLVSTVSEIVCPRPILVALRETVVSVKNLH